MKKKAKMQIFSKTKKSTTHHTGLKCKKGAFKENKLCPILILVDLIKIQF